MTELPRQICGGSRRNVSRTYARRAHGWRALALAALYPLRVFAQRASHQTERPEEGRTT
jgi:hypothetical protein